MVVLGDPSTNAGVAPVDAVNGVSVNLTNASLPLPTGASTSANQTTGNTSLASIDSKITAVNTGAVVVSSSTLPTGAATSAKQPALGTAGTASADVLTVQGITSMTPLKVDNSANTQPISASSLPLPTGAATSANQTTGNSSLSTIATNTGNIPAKGQATMANSTPVAIASDQSAVAVSGTVTANAGTGTFTNQQTNNTADYDTGAGTQTMTMFGLALPASGGSVAGGTSSNPVRTDPTGTTAQPVSGTITANVGTTNGLALDATLTGGTQKTKLVDSGGTNVATVSAGGALKVDNSANTQPISGTVTANAGTGTFATKEVRSGTSAQTTVAGSATSVSLLASNTSRLGATIANDSTAALYVKLGATASTTSYTIKLLQDDYYEIPYGYTGEIDGIWASATGNARITELTA